MCPTALVFDYLLLLRKLVNAREFLKNEIIIDCANKLHLSHPLLAMHILTSCPCFIVLVLRLFHL